MRKKFLSTMRHAPRVAFAGDTEWRTALGFLVPLVAFVVGLIVLPVAGTFWDSLFLDVTFLPRRFIGLQNYLALWHDPAFWKSVRFTPFRAGVGAVETQPVSIALLLHGRCPGAACCGLC
jgi:multiple sugar transport system permease protein